MLNPEIVRTEVLVVGAGPAGLSIAEKTAKNNVETLVIEERKKIGQPIHTSGGSFIKDLKEFGIPSALYHPIHKTRLISPNNSSSFNYDEPVACMIDVTGTFEFLAERATKAGAKIIMETKGVKPLMKDTFVIGAIVKDSRSGEKEIFSKVLVDSTGYRATMLKQANLDPGFKRFGVGAEYEITAPYCDQDEIVVSVGSQIAPSGYAWVAPWGKERVRVGVGIIHPDSREDPKKYLNKFVNNASTYGVNLKDCKINELHFGLIPSDGLAKSFVGNGIMGVGDSSGQASALIGEGIRQSIEAGILASKTIVRAIEADDFSLNTLKEYQRAFKKRHEVELFIASRVNRIVRKISSDRQLDLGVELTKSLPSREVADILHTGFKIKHGKLLFALIPLILKEIAKVGR